MGQNRGGEKRAQPVHNPCTEQIDFWRGANR